MRLFKLWLGLPKRWDGVMLCRGRRVRVTVDDGAPDEMAARPSVLPLLIPPGSLERRRARQTATAVPLGFPAAPGPVRGWNAAWRRTTS